MKEYIIRETDDFLSLSTLFHESGMGVNIEERMPDRVIKMWRMDNARTGELMAAFTEKSLTYGRRSSSLMCKNYLNVYFISWG